ncbi:nitroreductase family protein [Pseudomonas sp.]|uniref:nitroreductase family protein n=1 Tax=Pseudomonas sp. TaxID=306 RepID=UPI002B650D95|nr:nitroreductase family protein [Pseudomonas sp.]HUE91180.1 nitroreductase family protein [Pseudomonas sp.]
MVFFKKIGRLGLCFFSFLYDYKRYFLYSAWNQNYSQRDERNYTAVKIYHSLEKSLSLKDRKENAGWENTKLLHSVVIKALDSGNLGFQDKVGLNVLKQFTGQLTAIPEAQKIHGELDAYAAFVENIGGVKSFGEKDFRRGELPDPESFFLSRYTLRDFSKQIVESSTVERAVRLAMKSPSVCNRQAWHIYDLKTPSAIVSALSCQNGNRGFGHKIKRLLVVTTDLRAFVSPKERYQHWIDGGMFAMSLVWAFHSLGVASCCLNWSQDPSDDIKFRQLVPIKSEHSVIMLIALGYPDEENKVCVSARRPLAEVYTQL